MKLGSSIRRRRPGGGKGFSWKRLFPKRPAGEREGEGRRWRLPIERRTLLILGILAGGGFAGGYLFSTRVLYPLPPPPGDLSTVPDLSGASPESAFDTLRALGLVLGPTDSLSHPTVPMGTIVGQSPLPGQLSLVGDTVRVTLSIGAERRPVPDVLRLTGDWARTILETAGFQVRLDSVNSENPRGDVVAIDPEPGTEATIPMEVRLFVSTGPPEFAMPLLVGLSEEEALAVIDSIGLVVGAVETRFRFGRDQGMVVEQEPPAASVVREGSTVRLVVGRRGQ
jgi:serine/threonine-protein kinase